MVVVVVVAAVVGRGARECKNTDDDSLRANDLHSPMFGKGTVMCSSSVDCILPHPREHCQDPSNHTSALTWVAFDRLILLIKGCEK